MGELQKVYLSGPMTGYVDNNFPAFEKHAIQLRKAGFNVVSPHEIEEVPSWDECLKKDIAAMVGCDAVVTMPGWQTSRGARLETAIAIMVGIPVMTVDDAYTYRT